MRLGHRHGCPLVPLGLNYVWRVLAVLLAPVPAALACTTTGTTIICNDAFSLLNPNTVTSSANDVTVQVTATGQSSGPAVSLPGAAAIKLTGRNTTLTNQGLVDPTLALAALGTSGVMMGNATNGGAVRVNNSGTLYGAGLSVLGLSLLNTVEGSALILQSNAAGSINIDNTGIISAKPGVLAGLLPAATPVIAAYGGAPITVNNAAGGVINGRVGLGRSVTGNSFVNAGAINGSVSMGQNSTNTFTAVTGSSVTAGGAAIGVDASVAGLNASVALGFAMGGTVDGGANGNNTLVLQNPGAAGVSGTGTASSAVYRNFSNLRVNGGTWTINGPLVSSQATLNGGLVNFDNNLAFGTGTLTGNGGALAPSVAGLSLANAIQLNAGGLGVQGANNLTLSGVIAGAGALDKSGAGVLTLNGANTHIGGVRLGGGGLALGGNSALGLGDLVVYGASALQAGSATNLSNNVVLNADLALTNPAALTLSGALSGSAALVKSGAGVLTLTGANSHGATRLGAGGLIVGNDAALGAGPLTVNGAATLASSTNVALQNAIVLNNALTLNGADALTLNGPISAGGSLVKTGAGVLTLNGANTYAGGTTLAGGTVNVGASGAFGTGAVNVSGATTLAGSATGTGSVLANNFTLGNALTVTGDNNLTLNGALSGAGGTLVKSGAGTLTLNGVNSFGGGALNAGTVVAGANNALGTGLITVAGAATVDSAAPVSLGNQFVLNDRLTIGGSQDLTLAGALSGNGTLVKNGGAGLTLSAANTHTGGVLLNAGTLTLANAQGLGTGLLDVQGASTLAAGNLTVANGIRLGSTLGIATSGQTLNLSGALSGGGAIALNDAGALTLSGNNTHTGGVALNAGTLVAASDTALGGGTLTVGGDAGFQSTAARNFVNNVALNGNLTVGGANDVGLGGAIAGPGRLVMNGTGTLTLTGANSHAGTTIASGTVQAGAGSLGASVLNNSKLVIAQGADATYGGAISGAGSVDVAANASTLVLSGVNTFTGGLNLLSGTVEARGGQALADALSVNLSGGTVLRLADSETFGSLAGAGRLDLGAGATVRMGQDNADSMFGGALSGAGSFVKAGSGSLTLTGNNTQSGNMDVAGGTLNVNGSLASSQVNVGAGATLAGSGVLSGLTTIASGGALSATSGQTLTMGGLTLNQGSQFNVALGAPQATPQTLVQVNGNLTLDGDLNVTDKGGFGEGVYRLITYTGLLTDNGLALGSLPPGTVPSNLQIQTAVNQQVNLVVQTSDSSVQFWNGVKQLADGTLAGGAGTWQAGSTNWTNQAGQLSQTWGGSFAVFGGAAGGAVTVAGEQAVTGMQFFTDGYTLQGGALRLAADASNFRVDPTLTGTINSVIRGAGALNKRDQGTLVLGGANEYTGGTQISEGVLQVSADNNLGAAGTAVRFGGGTLRVTGTGYTGTTRAIDVGAGAGFDIADAGNVFTLNQALSGAGRLTKSGAGTLALGGDNSAIGGVTLAGGTIAAGSNTALGSGVFDVTGSGALDASAAVALANDVAIGAGATLTNPGSNDLTLNGVVSGANGALSKTGAGTLTLNGENTYGGGTALSGGAIRVGSNAALGAGALNVNGAAGLLSDGSYALDNAISLGANLTAGGAGNLTLNNAIAGSGTLIKSGAGSLTLNGVNTHAATRLDSGLLVLGNNAALGAGLLSVTGDAALEGAGNLALDNAVEVTAGADLTLAQTHDTELLGTIGGAGGLIVGGPGTTLTLAGANAYQGGTQLNGGNLRLGQDASLGTGALLVNADASLSGAQPGPALTVANGVTLSAALNVTGDRDITLSGGIDGAGALAKSGASTLTLDAANSYAGGTTLSAGVLRAGNDAALGTGALTVAGAATLASDQAVALANNVVLEQTLALDATNGLRLNGEISGAGGLTATGAGALTLAGANTYAGGTRIDGGTLRVGADTSLGSGVLTVNGAAALQGLDTAVTLANAIVLDGAPLAVSGGQDIALAGTVSGSGAISKLDGNTLTLSGDNAYQGGTTLAQGLIVAGSDQALGAGALTVSGDAALDATQAVTLNNGIVLSGGDLTVNGSQDLTLAGGISGGNGLIKNGGATLALSGDNTYAGGTTLAGGALIAGSDTALGAGALTVTGGATLSAADGVSLANAVVLDNALTVDGAGNWTLGGDISGNAGLVKTGAGTLTLAGNNSYAGGTQLQAGAITGDSNSIAGPVATSAGTTLTFNQDASGAYSGVLSGAGNVEKSGTGALTLSGANTLTGAIGVAQGTLATQGSNIISSASGVRIDDGATLQLTGAESIAALSGAGKLQVDGSLALGGDVDSSFGGDLAGAGSLTKVGTGTLALGGASSHTGVFDINSGTVRLTGTLASSGVNVNGPSAILTGSGTANGAVNVNNGGRLSVNSAAPGALTVGALTLDNASSINAVLGAANASSLINVHGDVDLNGTLNIEGTPDFGVGVYRVITYSGAATSMNLALGALPPGVISLQTNVAGQVNVLNESQAGEIQFWQGGSGAWDSVAQNWTDAAGTASAWGSRFGVFEGEAGTVAVAGTQTFQGLQFSTDGYTLAGGALNATPGSDGVATLRVEAGMTATLDTSVAGNATIAKRDGGTLVFSQANSYVGDTRLEGGVLQISADDQLGDATNRVVFDGGTLRYAGESAGSTARDFTLEGAGAIDVATSPYTVTGLVSGVDPAATLTKTGAGTLVLAGANTYVGGTLLQAGEIKVSTDTALGSGTLTAADGTTLSNDVAVALANNVGLQGDVTFANGAAMTLSGEVAGPGGLIKTGPGTLTLANANSYQGDTRLDAGQITVGASGALGTGTLVAADGTALDASTTATLQNDVVLNGALALPGSADLTLNGGIGGTGSLVKNGTDTLALNGANSFQGGVALNSGTLALGSDTALGVGQLSAADGTTLTTSVPVSAANGITLAGITTITGAGLSLNGQIAGAGGLVKDGAGVLTLTGDNSYQGGTRLAGGTLALGSDTAVGTGTLTAAGGTTLLGLGVSLDNTVQLEGPVTVGGSGDLALNGVVGGTGPLTKTGSSTLTLGNANTYAGGTVLADGAIIAGNNAALGTGGLTVAGPGTLQAGASGIALGNDIALDAPLTVSGANDLTLAGDITGGGSLVKADGSTLTLTGQNQYTGGTTLTGGTLAGNTGSLTGNIATAAGTTVVFNQNAGDGAYAGAITGGGGLVKNGGDVVTLTGANTYTGGTLVNAGTLAGNAGSLQGNITVVDGSAIVFDQNGVDGTYAGNISTTGNNTGTLTKDGNAALTLTGNNNVGGGTTVNSGTLRVDGTLTGGGVTVNAGANLGGSGAVVADVELEDDAHLVAGTPGNPISFARSLALSNGTQLDFTLGTPNSATTAVTVAQDLRLDGVLNIADGGNLGTGVYRLFAYGGTLTDNALQYGTLPSGLAASQLTLQTQPNQINLVLESQPGEIQFWNGAKTTPDGIIAGGSGAWSAAGTNWTDASGATAETWNGKYAVFSGAAGTVSIEGAQNVTGLQFLTDGYTLQAGAAGAIAVAQAQAPIRVENGATATISAPITGAGGIEKSNGGTLILEGANTYTGNTAIRSGVLQVSADDQLGNGGAVSIDGGTLRIADPAYATTARNISLDGAGGGIDVVAAGQTFTLNQAINGSGALIKQGDGTLVLNGVNGYTGGTLIAGGTLEGNSASIQGAVDTSAGTTLHVNQASDGALTGPVRGAGQLVKEGDGALTLAGVSSYTGGTQVNAGTLIGDTSSLQGAIANNATLVFNQGEDGAFAGNLSGSGNLVKQGGGLLAVNGDHTYSGNATIEAGTVQLGSAQSPATLPASVQVNPGATLTGNGAIASLTNAGTVQSEPASGGGLKISNSFSNAAGATLAVNVGPESATNVHVAGSATLDGALQVTSTAPLTAGSVYTVLTADQGVQGSFASATLPELAFLDGSVAYDPNNVTVSFQRNDTGFESVAETSNQSAVAQALGRSDPGSPLYASILGLSRDQASAAFRQLSGDSHASLASALVRSSESVRTLPMNHLRDSLRSEGRGQACGGPGRSAGGYAEQFSCQRNVWTEVLGNWQSQDGDGNAPSYRQRTGGVLAGGDIRVGDGWRVGMALGYQDSTIWQDSRNAKADVDSYSITLFGGKSFVRPGGSAWNVMAGAAYSWQDIETRRNLAIGGNGQELKADYDGNTTQIFGELGYAMPVAPNATIEPFVGAAWIKQRTGGFSEDGGSAALSAGSESNDVTTTTVGVRGNLDTQIAGAPARLRATLGWRHAMGDVDPERTMAFSTGPSFTVAGTPIARDAAVAELGAEVSVSKNAAIGLSYQGQFGNGSRENAGFLNVRWRF
ncbi:autotransporter-associated beta strand repeat-containing protein [Achromobacter arsenitoxydans]|uniref:Outer membrane autotransporter n=1 Tax=Achromobacter arsenitoxydans SY8 TaxID=477184 RepID=H0F7X8_9BURK|nr:autotransporter-associated beta strand repeat-containing protein [Achromobacter arsenitoxydans]EHK65411.1 outer membrane autotransporter [Achromobacter arsenitoxydans SY8]